MSQGLLSIQEQVAIRADALKKARAFFEKKGILEVDPPALTQFPSLDANINAVEVPPLSFLHTSFEYPMKRLLAQGSDDIYTLAHVYRQEEQGRWHRTEFTMAEWYRKNFSLHQLLLETVEFCQEFLPTDALTILTYEQAFEKFAGFNPFSSQLPEIERFEHQRDLCLHYHLAHTIEKQLGLGEITAILDYPITQAALAKVKGEGSAQRALRFELYFQGVELANGYEELQDPIELKKRLTDENAQRVKEGRRPYPLDETLFQISLPPCSGVAVGFDRLFALSIGNQYLSPL